VNLKRTLAIASMTVEENLRKRILYILLFLSLLLVGSSSLINTFSLGSQVTIIKDLSISGIGFFGLLFTISLFLNAIPGEIEQRTIYPLLAQPITRADYLWGKFLGIFFIVAVNLLVLGGELMIVLLRFDHVLNYQILEAVMLIIVQCGIVGAIIVFFSLFVSYPLTLSVSLFIFIVGNLSTSYVAYLHGQAPRYLALTVTAIKLILPKFDLFNIKNAVVHGHAVAAGFIPVTCLYGVAYMVTIMMLATIVFERKDL
jgi:Cu-processing system permease protein